jgi:hypothetical protein
MVQKQHKTDNSEVDSTRRVKAEVVGAQKKTNKFFEKIKNVFNTIKLIIAIILDLADLIIGIIPFVNAAYDVACCLILLIILKHKKLALLPLIEVPLIIPPLSFVNMLLPICTIAVLLDDGMENVKVYRFR